MSSLGVRLLTADAPLALHRFRRLCRLPAKVQASRLLDIVKANADTAFGRRHHFDRIESFADYQALVPVSTYDDLQVYIAAAMDGRTRQLTAEDPLLFTMTSGTTGARKYIPLTPDERRAKRYRTRLWVASFFHDHPAVRAGRILSMVSPEVESHASNGIACGAESGHFYRTTPRAVQSMYSTPYDAFTIADYDAKYYTVLRIAAAHRIGCIVTANPSTIVLLADRLARHTEAIIRDVHDGTLRADLPLAPDLRASLGLEPDHARGRYLERAAAASPDSLLRPLHVWPELAALGCWKAGSVRPYLSRFDHYFAPGTPIRDLGYLATETAATLPLSDEGAGGVAAIATDVLEFYPADVEGPPAGERLLHVDQLDLGAQYNVVVTTASGLYRYDMNDIVTVVGRYERTPVLEFVQKGHGIVSFTGEKLTESQVLAAVDDSFSDPLEPASFIAAVAELVDAVPRVALYVESDELDEARGRAVLTAFDASLARRNMEYEAKRDSGRYQAPVLRLVAPGATDRYRQRMVQRGRADGQFKILRLTDDPTFAAEFSVKQEIRLGRSVAVALAG